MTLDFTQKKYSEIIDAISRSGYRVITISDYLSLPVLPEKFIILRHDVDIDSEFQVRFAELEHEMGIHTSYYFRYVPKVYKKTAIDKIHDLGHEIGYHYEVFTKAKGDENKAVELFREELNIFKENWHSVTVCPHGGSFIDNIDGYGLTNIIRLIPKLLSNQSVFTNWSNFDLWEKYRFEDFQIIGDAYRSVDFSGILYLSDTGRSWDARYKRLDKVESLENIKYTVRKSDDIIRIIEQGDAKKIYLLIHFEQWKDNFPAWISWYLAQLIRRNGKKVIFKMGKN